MGWLDPEQARKYYREWAATRHRQNRALAIEHYGSKCDCCGEWRAEFLCIDHIHGGGNAHRRSLSADGKTIVGSSNFYAWLRRNNWPAGFRLLCHNCNFAIGHYGHCPHEQERS